MSWVHFFDVPFIHFLLNFCQKSIHLFYPGPFGIDHVVPVHLGNNENFPVREMHGFFKENSDQVGYLFPERHVRFHHLVQNFHHFFLRLVKHLIKQGIPRFEIIINKCTVYTSCIGNFLRSRMDFTLGKKKMFGSIFN